MSDLDRLLAENPKADRAKLDELTEAIRRVRDLIGEGRGSNIVNPFTRRPLRPRPDRPDPRAVRLKSR